MDLPLFWTVRPQKSLLPEEEIRKWVFDPKQGLHEVFPQLTEGFGHFFEALWAVGEDYYEARYEYLLETCI